MKNLRHPNFILGIISAIVMFIGIAMKSSGMRAADYFFYGGGLLAGVHWIWGIIDVAGRKDLKPFQKRFWLIAVIAVPAFGSMVFYGMHQSRDKITT